MALVQKIPRTKKTTNKKQTVEWLQIGFFVGNTESNLWGATMVFERNELWRFAVHKFASQGIVRKYVNKQSHSHNG